LGGGVFGFPSLSLSDGLQEQNRPWWYIGVCGCGAFPQVRSVLGAVAGLDAGLFEKLPNEFGALCAVVIEGVGRAIM
jgi:hypothetical protein